jgi:hypothetical protein
VRLAYGAVLGYAAMMHQPHSGFGVGGGKDGTLSLEPCQACPNF